MPSQNLLRVYYFETLPEEVCGINKLYGDRDVYVKVLSDEKYISFSRYSKGIDRFIEQHINTEYGGIGNKVSRWSRSELLPIVTEGNYENHVIWTKELGRVNGTPSRECPPAFFPDDFPEELKKKVNLEEMVPSLDAREECEGIYIAEQLHGWSLCWVAVRKKDNYMTYNPIGSAHSRPCNASMYYSGADQLSNASRYWKVWENRLTRCECHVIDLLVNGCQCGYKESNNP